MKCIRFGVLDTVRRETDECAAELVATIVRAHYTTKSRFKAASKRLARQAYRQRARERRVKLREYRRSKALAHAAQEG